MEKLIIELERNKDKFENNKAFIEGEKYWQEMKNSGLIQESGYIISPLDTIGRDLYNDKSQLGSQSMNRIFIK